MPPTRTGRRSTFIRVQSLSIVPAVARFARDDSARSNTTSHANKPLTTVGKFHHGALYIQRRPAGKIGDSGEYIFHRNALPRLLFQPFTVKHISACVLS